MSRLHPLILPAAALMGGIFSAAALGPWPVWPLLTGAALVLAVVLGLGLAGKGISPALLALACLLAGAGLLSLERSATLPPDHLSLLADGKTHRIEAIALSPAQPGGRGMRLMASALSLDGQPVGGLLRLSLAPELAPPPAGSRFALRASLRPITSLANPGGFDYAGYMATQGVHAQAYAGRSAQLTVLGAAELPWPRALLLAARQRLAYQIEALPPTQGRELLRALVLGQRGGLSGEVREAFGVTGAAHLLAISGLHIGLVWGLAYALLRWLLAAWPGLALRWPVIKLAAALALIPAGACAALAGGSTPTLRALVMIACLVAALWASRPYRPSGGLALAALVIGLLWPESPLTLSFQMSFVAVAAILLAAAPLARWLRGLAPGPRLAGAVLGWLGLGGVVGLAVWPLAVQNFHQLPVYSLPANALLIPLVAMFTLPMALIAAGVGLVWAGGGQALFALAAWPAEGAVFLVGWLAGLPGAVRYLAGPGPWAALLFYLGALAALTLPKRWAWGLGAGLGAAGLVLWLGLSGPPPADGKLRAWVLDVGQGSATIARLPQGQVMVIDGGGWGGSDFDFGRQVIAPFLWGMGFGKVEVVACSHRDSDHAGGLPFVARWFSPRQVWTNGEAGDGGWYAGLLATAKEKGIPVLGPREIAQVRGLGGASLRLLWPPPGADLAALSSNDRSLWLGVGLGGSWLWLPGDGGPKVEKAVTPLLPTGGSQVLLGPHHGAKNSLTPALLERMRPQAVLFSSGCWGRWPSPSRQAQDRATKAGAGVHGTNWQGCLELTTGGGAWRIMPTLSPPRRCLAPWPAHN
ncbi:MAG: DNA internalization-related competence protein ComEC/Rec2 [Desulfarculus sp.]|nr:DNA internalization-related competence protein ComEC/Rec2 [Pseudomonadota bacterium]MBV1718171.1 DNA internalization-related competence protein ComEC/Rec2 [Desulfarculus sp.]MBU4576341.1 DNA internalization-related competence protein ComEC/Rec2 [Pseudomonadota bacterium]MBU4598665.1 DNA internalization-related competence protein ComEC/Rec2 [Pseudomonadota bacterium]MBV1738779.1 DNA internalization-related competence protein ComEC/Rec2 [Desulfarculus sp.]